MNGVNSQLASSYVVNVNWADRWAIYRRLQELQIPCHCKTDRPLQVAIHSPTAAIQLWSAVRQIATPRCELARWLNDCWHLESNVNE